MAEIVTAPPRRVLPDKRKDTADHFRIKYDADPGAISIEEISTRNSSSGGTKSNYDDHADKNDDCQEEEPMAEETEGGGYFEENKEISSQQQPPQAEEMRDNKDSTPARQGEGGTTSKPSRRGSLVERVMGWASSDDEEDNPYGYKDAAPSKSRQARGGARRGSLVEKIMGWEQQEQQQHTDDSNPYGYEDAAPTRRRRGSLVGRVMAWQEETAEANPYGYEDAPPTRGQKAVDQQHDTNPYGYEEAAPTRRRGSLLGQIMGWDNNRNDDPNNHTNDYGYEDATPTRRGSATMPGRRQSSVRRGSMVERIMAWAGAVNEEHFYQGDQQYASSSSYSRNETERNRRASMHGDGPRMVPPVRHRRAHSSDDIDGSETGEYGGDYDYEGNGYYEGEYCGEQYDDGMMYPPEEGGRVERRNSLHAMVERAMAYVNLTKTNDPRDDELCAFGTRRDSLF